MKEYEIRISVTAFLLFFLESIVGSFLLIGLHLALMADAIPAQYLMSAIYFGIGGFVYIFLRQCWRTTRFRCPECRRLLRNNSQPKPENTVAFSCDDCKIVWDTWIPSNFDN